MSNIIFKAEDGHLSLFNNPLSGRIVFHVCPLNDTERGERRKLVYEEKEWGKQVRLTFFRVSDPLISFLFSQLSLSPTPSHSHPLNFPSSVTSLSWVFHPSRSFTVKSLPLMLENFTRTLIFFF